ncbi:MAG: helix-turn-helix domain-containing protein [Magnetospirillum sp.]|nr:helix-turn-helix domain-containing protein [Magnetospirillum sp.]
MIGSDNVEKAPNPLDTHLGMRIKARRQSLNLSAAGLAHALAVGEDVLALMERGIQRLSASQLHRLAQVLDVPISYFFESAPREHSPGFPGTAFAEAFVTADDESAETLDLVRAFLAIDDAAARKRVTELALTLAAKSQA